MEFVTSTHLSEDVKHGLCYSFYVSNKQCHQWVHCKDFLNDVVAATVNTCSPFSIYGLRVPTIPISLKTCALLLKEEEPQMYSVKAAIEFVNIVNDLVGFNKTRVNSKVLPFYKTRGDKRWLHDPRLLSLYTLLLRLGLTYDGSGEEFIAKIINSQIKTRYEPDFYSASDLHKAFEFVKTFDYSTNIRLNYPQLTSINVFNFHHHSGITSWLQNNYFRRI